MTYALVRTSSPPFGRVGVAAFSRLTGAHPDLVRRLVMLGVLNPDRDAAGVWWFGPDQFAALARARRLRAGLGLNYSSLALVTELLDRIADLEHDLRRGPAPPLGNVPTPLG